MLTGRKAGHKARTGAAQVLVGGLGIAALLGFVVAGPAAAATKVTVVHYGYYWHGEAWRNFVDWAAREFEKSHPNIDIQITVAGGPNQGAYDQKLVSMIAGGTPPDVAEMNANQAHSFVSQDVFLDLRPLMAKEKSLSWDVFSPAAVQMATWTDGRIWGVPIDVFPTFTFFNQDLFEETGLQTPVDLGPKGWTWDALLKAATRLTVDTNGDGIMDRYGLDRLWAWWGAAVHQAGGELYNRTINPTRATYNTPAVIQGLKFVQDLYWKYKVAVPNTTGTSSTHTFWFGNVGISTVDGPGRIGASLRDVKFTWDVGPQPRGPARGGSRFTMDAIEVLGSTKHPAEVWEWVKFLTTNETVVRRFVADTGRLPALKSVQGEYTRLVPYGPRHAAYMAYEAANPESAPAYLIPRAMEVDAIKNPLIQQVLDGTRDPAAVVVEIDEKLNRLFASQK